MKIKNTAIILLVVSIFIVIPSAAEDIHQTIRDNQLAKVKNLLKMNPELVNHRDSFGMTPLHTSLFGGKKEMIDLLITNGADVDAGNKNGLTPLMMAAYFGNKEVVQLLLDKGANLEKSHISGMTPLLFGISGSRKEVTDLLIEKGASLKVSDEQGNTPLLLAVLNGSKDIVALLIDHGEELNVANSRGSTPLLVAERESLKGIVDLLLAKGAVKTKENIHPLKGEYLGQTRPGLTPLIFAPGFISTEYTQLNAVFTPDRKEFYFSNQKRNTPLTIMVTKQEKQVWSKPAIASFSGKYSDVDHFITSDGKKFFFCSQRPVTKDGKPKQDHDLWLAERIGAQWSEPKHLGFDVNSDRDDYYPTVTSKGVLYFSSQREGEGTNNIYRSVEKGSKYTKAEKFGDAINTKYREYDPYIATDESYIIFASERPDGFGSSDLYISFRKKDGTWTMAKNMGNKINSTSSEFTPMLSPDGKYLFFTRGKGSVNDIYWIDAQIIESSKPNM